MNSGPSLKDFQEAMPQNGGPYINYGLLNNKIPIVCEFSESELGDLYACWHFDEKWKASDPNGTNRSVTFASLAKEYCKVHPIHGPLDKIKIEEFIPLWKSGNMPLLKMVPAFKCADKLLVLDCNHRILSKLMSRCVDGNRIKIIFFEVDANEELCLYLLQWATPQEPESP